MSLHGTNTGKSDCEEESKESFSHGREGTQTAGLQSTHFKDSRFQRGKRENRRAFAPQNARECDASAEARALDSETSPEDEPVRMAEFRQLRAAGACARIGAECLTCFWDA